MEKVCDFMDIQQNSFGVGYGDTARSYANQLNLELHECSFADFNCRGINKHFYNRIFAVRYAKGEPAFVGNSETGVQMEMKPGYFYFFSPGMPLSFNFKTGTGFFAFHFNLRYCAYQDIFLSMKIMEKRYDPEFISRLENAYSDNPDLPAAFLIKGLLFEKIAELLPNDRKLFQEDCFEKYRKLFEYISKHASAKLTIGELAEISGMSRDYLSRNFPRDIGIPLKKYIMNILLSRAELLLRNRELTVREIAKILNFNDEYYFSHFFRRESGFAPGQYRKQAQFSPTSSSDLQ